MVVPPIAQAATPVVAVTTILFFVNSSLALSKVFKMWLFPLPAGPVKKTEWPERTDSIMVRCCTLRVLA